MQTRKHSRFPQLFHLYNLTAISIFIKAYGLNEQKLLQVTKHTAKRTKIYYFLECETKKLFEIVT